MVKPSIFSKDYEKKMKKRRKRIGIAVTASVIVVILTVVYIRGTFKALVEETNKVKNSITTEKGKDKAAEEKKATQIAETKAKVDEKKEEQGYAVQLSDGRNINVVYEVKNNDKTFKSIAPADSNVYYNISPSGKNMVIFDDKSQSILLVDTNGNKQDLTNQQYVSTSGTVIEKNSQIANQANYVWCASPRFIDENNIAYVSQLPWVGKTEKYVWIESIKTKNHMMVQGIQSEDIKFDQLTPKGLQVIAGGRTVYLTASGAIVE